MMPNSSMAWTASGEPVLVAKRSGGFLAMTKPGERPSIGVSGATKDEARYAYARELGEWRKLHELAQTDRVKPPADGGARETE